jgi:hypothetical protein
MNKIWNETVPTMLFRVREWLGQMSDLSGIRYEFRATFQSFRNVVKYGGMHLNIIEISLNTPQILSTAVRIVRAMSSVTE